MTDPGVVDQSALMLKVQSPGSLPTGVASDKLLSTQSMPRNPCLMNAMRVLGLVEQSSQGFDRMWLSMLISGREAPEVEEGSESVSVTFLAGTPVASNSVVYSYRLVNPPLPTSKETTAVPFDSAPTHPRKDTNDG
ncbi:ATP-binding protein, partial [Corynebacterium flavescens]|uniref:ATP-binding protein n=2 Tax=Corynebacterium flavescens TaxID=28028 RepID=UPI00127A849A